LAGRVRLIEKSCGLVGDRSGEFAACSTVPRCKCVCVKLFRKIGLHQDSFRVSGSKTKKIAFCEYSRYAVAISMPQLIENKLSFCLLMLVGMRADCSLFFQVTGLRLEDRMNWFRFGKELPKSVSVLALGNCNCKFGIALIQNWLGTVVQTVGGLFRLVMPLWNSSTSRCPF
jgi:hypothetical protein